MTWPVADAAVRSLVRRQVAVVVAGAVVGRQRHAEGALAVRPEAGVAVGDGDERRAVRRDHVDALVVAAAGASVAPRVAVGGRALDRADHPGVGRGDRRRLGGGRVAAVRRRRALVALRPAGAGAWATSLAAGTAAAWFAAAWAAWSCSAWRAAASACWAAARCGLLGGALRGLGGLLLGEPALLLAPLRLEGQAHLLVGEALLLDLLEVLDLCVGLGGQLLVAHPLRGDLVLLGGQRVGLALRGRAGRRRTGRRRCRTCRRRRGRARRCAAGRAAAGSR